MNEALGYIDTSVERSGVISGRTTTAGNFLTGLILEGMKGQGVATLSSAGEGGPYGEALLAAYMIEKGKGETLEDYLQNKIFANAKEDIAVASKEEVEGFNKFLERYKAAVPVEAKAVECVKGQHIK